MSDDERVLRSFVEEGEQLLGLWTATKADSGKGRLVPMGGGEETVAVTDERLLWFTSELEEVAASAVDSIEREYVKQQAAPMIVNAGGLLFILGVFGTIGAFLANAGDLMIVMMPAMTGLALFLGARVFASTTGREGETRTGYRVRLRTDDGIVSIWTEDEDTADAIAAALAEASGVTVVDGDGNTIEDLDEAHGTAHAVTDEAATEDEAASGAEESVDASGAGDEAGDDQSVAGDDETAAGEERGESEDKSKDESEDESDGNSDGEEPADDDTTDADTSKDNS